MNPLTRAERAGSRTGTGQVTSLHFLEFSLTKNINIGVFESILWQSKAENVNKGFEFALDMLGGLESIDSEEGFEKFLDTIKDA